VGYGLLVAPQNRWEDEDDAGHMSRSSGLLHQEASWARVSLSSLKTGEGVARMGMWHHHGGRVEVKQKTIGSMASGAA
jgi:hypothetical protein